MNDQKKYHSYHIWACAVPSAILAFVLFFAACLFLHYSKCHKTPVIIGLVLFLASGLICAYSNYVFRVFYIHGGNSLFYHPIQGPERGLM